METTEVRKLTITKQRLLDWYFDGGDESEEIKLALANKLVDSLFKEEKFEITVEDIFNNECVHGSIRAYFLEEFETPEGEDCDETQLMDLGYEYELTLI